ncbi:hypothetical protein BJ508DRAFT_314773 [Ascobolus immersus RN42]|uniref:Glutathione S-transferase n=1 Tax=Ascobolus immersus RN42 TaxID=1160509 RepID=A0A3N4HH47_ASCIM|nr:hypothetical protein BJ508DRAFT_314773 [Ascobolus immersus RN42]
MASNPDITLYAYKTLTFPRVAIALEEVGIPYTIINVNVEEHDNLNPEYKRTVSITGQVPALIDASTGLKLTESAAIMFYIVDKYGPHLTFPAGSNEYYELVQFIDFVTDLTLMVGFGKLIYDPINNPDYGKTPGIEGAMRWRVSKNLTVLNDRLKEQREKYPGSEPWLVGGKFSAADISAYATVLAASGLAHIEIAELGLDELVGWKERIGARESAKKVDGLQEKFADGDGAWPRVFKRTEA